MTGLGIPGHLAQQRLRGVIQTLDWLMRRVGAIKT
jgi:hypothetical protein